MEFIKNFNNNAALVRDQNGTEWVVVGNGIGFGKKKGDSIDKEKITRRFIAAEKNMALVNGVDDIDSRTLTLTNKVVHLVEQKQQTKFNDYQYLALADHIDFAIKRGIDGIELNDGTVRWEVSKLFPDEFALAQEAVKLLRSESKVNILDSETVYLTYHFLNSESDQTKVQETMRFTQLIGATINIVQYQYGVNLDVNSFNFGRFVAHLRAFMIRHMSPSRSQGSDLDPDLLQLIKRKYPKAYGTVEKIGNYIQQKTGWTLQPDDKVYLTLHVWRVTHRQEKE